MDRKRLLVGLLVAAGAILAVLMVRTVFRGPLAGVSVALSELIWGPVEKSEAPAPAEPARRLSKRRPETPADRKVREQLEETIVSFTFNEQPVMEALDFVMTLGNVNIIPDRAKFTDAGQTITLEVNNIPLGAALGRLCEQLGMQYAIVHGVVFISDARGVREKLYPPPPTPPMVAKDQLPAEDRPVFDQLDQTIVSFTFNEQPVADAIDFFATLGKVNIVLDRGKLEKDQTVTLKLNNVKLATALELLAEQLDLRYTIRERVVFVSDEEGVAKRIAGAARTGLSSWPAYRNRRTWRKLQNTIISFTFNELQAMEAVDFLQTLGEVRITLDPTKLKAPKRTVTLKLSNVPLEVAVKLLAEQLDLTYVIRDGVVFVSDEEGIRKRK